LADQRSPQPPVEANRAQRRTKKKTSTALFVVPVLIAVAAVALFLVLRGGDSTGLPFIGGGGGDDVPAFDFTVKRVKVVATSEKADAEALTATAEGIGDEITPILVDMFTAAFLDPANWDGDYEDVFATFDDAARPSAEENVQTLTLGADAGDRFETVKRPKGSFSYRVLFSPDGDPDTVVVTFSFSAFGEGTDGTYTSIVSDGQLFMRDAGGWRITAFSVARNDEEAEAPTPAPAATGSTSP
jgi:hypothetical protein